MKYIKVPQQTYNKLNYAGKKNKYTQQGPRTADIKYDKFSFIPKFPANFSDSFSNFISKSIEQRWTSSYV